MRMLSFCSTWNQLGVVNASSSVLRTWDNERHFKRMAQAGVFQSVKPDAVAPEWVKEYESEVEQAINALKSQ
jgi:hypothetical protein